MATVEITGAQDYDLLGRVIDFERSALAARRPALESTRGALQSEFSFDFTGSRALKNSSAVARVRQSIARIA